MPGYPHLQVSYHKMQKRVKGYTRLIICRRSGLNTPVPSCPPAGSGYIPLKMQRMEKAIYAVLGG